MTLLTKALAGQNLPDKKDQAFEEWCLKTISDTKLLPVQKANLIRNALTDIAETDYQKTVGQAYSHFCDAMVNGDLALDLERVYKAVIMTECAIALLKIAEERRNQK